MRRRSRWLAGLLTLLVLGGVVYALWPTSPINIKRDPGPPLRIDRTTPVEITFSETWFPSCNGKSFAISPDGRVSMTRSSPQHIGTRFAPQEETTFMLPPEVMATLPELVESSGILELHASYELKNTFDGTHRYVSISQGGRTKSVACRNHFPPEFTTFTQGLTG
ncbi:MAG: hypothetical protein U0792_11495 [Gemmataceae bacterium]